MKKGVRRNPNALYSFREVLTPAECEQYEKVLHAYEARRLGSKNHQETSFRRDVNIINGFIVFSGVAPWNWDENDFDLWCEFIGVTQKMAMSTQRSYQTAIRVFLKFVVENHRLREEIKKLCGHYPVQICTSDNCIPHLLEREICKDMPSFSHEDIDIFFATISEQIAECKRFHAKAFQSFRRDKAMFATIYTGNLRACEAVRLSINSFQEEPFIKELKKFAYMNVWGKGSNGSGERFREVPVTDIEYPEVMEWYCQRVRPWYLEQADPNETALFLSERGKRISYPALRKRFNEIVTLAGLDGKNYTLHSFRRAGAFHDTCNMDMQTVQHKMGHHFFATLCGYLPSKDPYMREEHYNAIKRQLKKRRR